MKHSPLARRGYNYRRAAVVLAAFVPSWTAYCYYCTLSPIITVLGALAIGIPSLLVVGELLDNGNYYLKLANRK